MKNPEEVASALGITPASVESRLHAIGLDPASRASLRGLVDAVDANADDFLDALYARMRANPETAPLLASDATVARLKSQQRAHLREMFGADIDWAYALRRLWVGVVHHRVRLAPQWYIATHAHFVCDHLALISAASSSAAEACERAVALLETAFFDAGLALDAYGRSEETALWEDLHRRRDAPAPEAPRAHADARGEARGAPPVRRAYARIRLTTESAAARRAFLGLTDADLTALRALRGVVAGATPAMLDDFYAYFSQTPQTAALVPDETVARLRGQVSSYWLELVDGDFGRAYAASRMRVGVIHEKIGLSPTWYLAGLSRQVAALIRAVAATHPRPLDAVRALVRAVFFDVTFVIDAYMEARADTLLRTDGYANQLVAGLAAAVALVDARNRLISANPMLLSMVRGDPAVLYLMPVASVLPVPEVEPLLETLRASGAPRATGVGALGAQRLRITAMALTGHDGPDGAVALVLDDVTELYRVGDDLDRQSDQFEQLADAVGSVLWELDAESWTVTAINRAAVDLTGFRDVYFLGRPGAWLERVAPDDRARFMARARALRPGESAEVDYRMRRADDVVVWLRTRVARAATSPDGRLFGATTDVTAARRSHEVRIEALAQLAGGVAHVVNNCLTGVLCNIDLFADERGGVEAMPLLQDAVDATRKASSVVAQLLAFAGRQFLQPAALTLPDVTRATSGPTSSSPTSCWAPAPTARRSPRASPRSAPSCR